MKKTVYNNWKELCDEIGWKTTGGTYKKAREKELKTLCNYHKEGRKIIIDEIHDNPKPKIDKRKTTIENAVRAYRSDYCGKVLKEAIRIIYDIIGEQFDKQVYDDKALLGRPIEEGWQKLVMYCLDYFSDCELKDELYFECMLG